MDETQLDQLRDLIAQSGIGYYLVLTQDAHCSEYVSEEDKRRERVSGFTGSAGTAIIGSESYLELATDGRYWQQAGNQLGSNWVLRKEGFQGVATWSRAISERAKAEEVSVGVDPRLITYELAGIIRSTGVTLKPVRGLVDKVLVSPARNKKTSVFSVDTTTTGQSFGSKIADLRQALRTASADVIVLSALDEIAWLLNLRGEDIDYNPVFKSYLIVTQSEVNLYISQEDHELPIADLERDNINLRDYDSIFEDVQVHSLHSSVWVPPHSSWAMATAAGNRAILNRSSPVELAKAVKNQVEIDGARKSQYLCGKSIVQQLSWLQHELRNGKEITEFEAAQKLLQLREELPGFRGLSFETISSSGPNTAIIHYSPPKDSGRKISLDEVYLLDSGCQFVFGTTDTTRTCWFGEPNEVPEEIKEAFTLVLKGHISLATQMFPQGTHGYKLDSIARQHLWRYGLDYAHGTGHGVGSYLNVHEGPIGISGNYTSKSVPLEPGNIISNEPGYYKPDHFGVRIESLLAVKQAEPKRSSSTFLQFDTITCVPLDRNLINPNLLSQEELQWVNEYHRWVAYVLEKELDGVALEYLIYHTTPIHRLD